MKSFTNYFSEDLRKWFGTGKKGGAGGGGWDRYNTKGERVGKCAREPGEGKPKCLSKEKARKMSKDDRGAAVRRKRRNDSDVDRPGTGNKPINVSNKIGESMKSFKDYLQEKNVPTNPSLWSKFKSQAKSKFDVYPSAYANGWASKQYKAAGGKWKTESVEEEKTPKNCGCGQDPCVTYGKQNEDKDEFKPHMMYDPKTGKGYKAKTEKDHLDMKKKGYTHDDPETEKVEEGNVIEKSAAWQRKAGKNSEGGLNAKGRASYERENPGSDLKAPVSSKTASKNPDGKAAGRRKSFCARMGGMKGPMKDEKGKPTRKALALRKWDC